jgi:tetratricopeptide (TPR) repeat protein
MGGSGRPMLGAWVLGCSGDIERARERLERGEEYSDGGAWALLANALLKAYRGDRDGLLEYTEDQLAVAWQDFQYSAWMADAYAQVGAHEEALEWLRHAVEIGFYCAEFVARQNEYLAGLRDHPDFKDIVKQAQLGSARMRGMIADRMRDTTD